MTLSEGINKPTQIWNEVNVLQSTLDYVWVTSLDSRVVWKLKCNQNGLYCCYLYIFSFIAVNCLDLVALNRERVRASLHRINKNNGL